jgi:hypothetical protein
MLVHVLVGVLRAAAACFCFPSVTIITMFNRGME